MTNLFFTYIKFHGKLNRIQFLGALVFLIYLGLILAGISFIGFEVIERKIHADCQYIEVEAWTVGPNAKKTTMSMPDSNCSRENFIDPLGSLSLGDKLSMLPLWVMALFVFVYPLCCICAKRFNDIGLPFYVPFSIIISFEIMNEIGFLFLNNNNNFSLIVELMVIAICLITPSPKLKV